MKAQFKILEHPSDLGIEAHGSSIQEVFSSAAAGLMYVITGDAEIAGSESKNISIKAVDRENLLVRWLSEILYLFDGEKTLTGAVKFEILTDKMLKASVLGEKYDPSRHDLRLDVKAITYHKLKVEEKEGEWTARVFVDI